jgi:hypothetical protein
LQKLISVGICVSLFLATFFTLAAALGAQSQAPLIDFSGVYEDEDEREYEFTQVGKHIEATLIHLSANSLRKEFKVGEKIFVGEVNGSSIQGRLHIRYLVPELPRNCQSKFESWTPLALSPAEKTATVGEGEQDHLLILRGDYEGYAGTSRVVVDEKTGETEPGCGHSMGTTYPIVLTRHRLVTKPIPPTPGLPTMIVMRFYPPSVLAGGIISIDVHLANASGGNAAADRDYDIRLASKDGVVNPNEVKIKTGISHARTKLRTGPPGDIRVTATSGQGLKQDATVATSCGREEIRRLLLDTDRQRSTAEKSSPIPFKIKFVDASGAPTGGSQTKPLAFAFEGVGHRESLDKIANDQYAADNIPDDQCVSLQQIVSDEPGSTTVTAQFGGLQSKTAHFSFYVEIGWKLLLAVILGGCCGAFVKMVFARGRRPAPGRIILRVIASGIAGVVLFVFDYYVGSKYIPALSTGFGIAFATGVVGGFAGPGVFRMVTKIVSPGWWHHEVLHRRVNTP